MTNSVITDPLEWRNLTVLVTGGTGSFGKKFVETMLRKYKPKKLIIFSRDELKQFEMQQQFSPEKYPEIRYFIGDVRDRERLYRALDGVDVVVHAAALKQVPAAEYNPLEAVKTNVLGAANLIDAAIDRKVKRVLALSTDKAASPANLYGATKLCSDKLMTAANSYSGATGTRFAVVRYGNVVGSRGSVIPFFLNRRKTGVVPITDKRMTRFLITLDHGVEFVISSIQTMRGGEIFVPKIPSTNIMELANVIAPDCRHEIVGIRPGEKLHEIMVSEDDARSTIEYDDRYAILSAIHGEPIEQYAESTGGSVCQDGFIYSSETNKQWLSTEELQAMVKSVEESLE